jgi:hypothetical protein
VNFPFICSNIPAAPAYGIKEQVGEKKSTVCTHKYAECLLKNTSNKDNSVYFYYFHSALGKEVTFYGKFSGDPQLWERPLGCSL